MVVSAMVTFWIREGTLSGIITLQMICMGVAPMLWAASMILPSTSRRLLSTKRATKGHAAATSGTMVAVVPTAVPMSRRERGNTMIVTVEAVPWDTFLTRLESGDFDLYYGECRLTADWDLTALLSTEGSLNYGGWSDETTDRLLQAYRSNGADANLVALWQQLLDTAPFAPICFKSVSVVTTEGVVQGLSPTETAPLSPLGGWSVRLDA